MSTLESALGIIDARRRERAWECAFVMIVDHADKLTPEQFIACQVAVMRSPERAPLELIALAAHILGERQ